MLQPMPEVFSGENGPSARSERATHEWMPTADLEPPPPMWKSR